MNLHLHCGSSHCSLAEVKDAEAPGRTAAWRPIPYARLIAMLYNAVDRNGYSIVDEAHSLMRNGHRYFGQFQVRSLDQDEESEKLAPVLGLRSSYDHRWPVSLFLGIGLARPERNTLWLSELPLGESGRSGRRQTPQAEGTLPQALDKVIESSIDDGLEITENRIRNFHRTPIDTATAHDLLIRLIDADVITPSMLPKVLARVRDGRPSTLLGIYTAVSCTLTTHVSAHNALSLTPRLSDLLDGATKVKGRSRRLKAL